MFFLGSHLWVRGSQVRTLRLSSRQPND